MQCEMILILGGARSGKSSYAERLAQKFGRRILYVATAQAKDAEMQDRIQKHRQQRPDTWYTLEAPSQIGSMITQATETRTFDAILIDCLTLLVTNTILEGLSEHPTDQELDQIKEPQAQERLNKEIDAFLDAGQSLSVPIIIVSNEVGLGLVPPYPLARVYRDLLGRANQRLAAAATSVYLLVAGIPIDIKKLGGNIPE